MLGLEIMNDLFHLLKEFLISLQSKYTIHKTLFHQYCDIIGNNMLDAHWQISNKKQTCYLAQGIR
jgi:hypothetical protein